MISGFSGAPFDISGMATDRTSGDVYVCGTNVSASYIGTLDVTTGVISQIGGNITNAPGLIDIAINGDGDLFGWCIVNDATYTIDKTTGVATLLGSLGFNANYGQGGNYNPADGEIYLSAYNSATGPELRVMDQLTGATSYLAGLPGSQAAAFGFPGGGGVGSWLTLDIILTLFPQWADSTMFLQTLMHRVHYQEKFTLLTLYSIHRILTLEPLRFLVL